MKKILQEEHYLLPKVIRLLQEVKPETSGSSVKITSHLHKELGLDSLDLVEFVLLMEWKFSISITDREAESLTTVEQAIHLIRLKSTDG